MRPDLSLTERLRRGDPRALEELYDQTVRRAFGLAYRILGDEDAAADAVQEAYVAVWQQVDRLDDSRGRVEGLVLTMVHHKAVDALRARARQTQRSGPLDFDVVDDAAASVFEAVVEDLSRQDVTQALDSLPPDQRAVIDLAYFAGLTQSEIATRLGLPLGTVKSRLRLGMEKLRLTFGIGEAR